MVEWRWLVEASGSNRGTWGLWTQHSEGDGGALLLHSTENADGLRIVNQGWGDGMTLAGHS